MKSPTPIFEEDESRPKIEALAIAEIKQDAEIAARDPDPIIVAEYAERMAAGDTFPPVDVFKDDDGTYWLSDGWQRIEAARRNGHDTISCAVCSGDRRAATLASVGSNAEHGRQRTAEEKRRAVLKLLNDAEWKNWSAREIARQCRVSDVFVGKVRTELAVVTASVRSVAARSESVQFRTKHGTPAIMDVSRIGARATVAVEQPAPARPRSVTILKPAFGEGDIAELERLAGRARDADRAFLDRIKKVARLLAKTVEHLQARAKRKPAAPRGR